MTEDNEQTAPLAIALEAAKCFVWECKFSDEFDHWLSDGSYDLNFFQDAEQGRVVAIYRAGAAASSFPQKPLAAVEFKDGEWQPDRQTALKEAFKSLTASVAATYSKLAEFDALAAKHDAAWVKANELTEAGIPSREALD